jgi:hypothetical protein
VLCRMVCCSSLQGRLYEEAAKCLRRVNPRASLRLCEFAMKVYEDRVSTGSCAKVWGTMADTYETDLKDYKAAMDAYEKSADFLIAQDQHAKANEKLLKAAFIAASRYDFKRAIALYERVAAKVSENRGISDAHTLGRHLFNAGLCQLVFAARTGAPIQNVSDALDRYLDLSKGAFERAEEHKFLRNLVSAHTHAHAEEHPAAHTTLIVSSSSVLSPVPCAPVRLRLRLRLRPDRSPRLRAAILRPLRMRVTGSIRRILSISGRPRSCSSARTSSEE